MLGISQAAVRNAIYEGRLASVKLYGRPLVSRADLDAYKQRTQPDGVKKTGRPRRAASSARNLSDLTTLASEETLREIWDTPEEDEAWAHLGGIREARRE